jgi:hypothetical protein
MTIGNYRRLPTKALDENRWTTCVACSSQNITTVIPHKFNFIAHPGHFSRASSRRSAQRDSFAVCLTVVVHLPLVRATLSTYNVLRRVH